MSYVYQAYEEMDLEELGDEVRRRDWNIGEYSHSSQGVELLFRERYTSHIGYPGVKTCFVFGKDKSAAIRKFLNELDGQAKLGEGYRCVG